MSLSLNLQPLLQQLSIDGWLIADFHDGNPLARTLLGLDPVKHLTRRYFYWYPQKGTPIKIVHKIEKDTLNHLEGEVRYYAGWKELEAIFHEIFHRGEVVALEISDKNRIPSISFTDGGTVQLLESLGLKVVSSARLLQEVVSVLSEEKIESHRYASKVAVGAVNEAMSFIRTTPNITEKMVQEKILDYFQRNGCITNFPPIVAAGVNSADPHYFPKGDGALIQPNDLVLVDLWCRKNEPNSIFADMTRMCIAGDHPKKEYLEIFFHVLRAQQAAVQFLKERLERREKVFGYEVDEVARKVIQDAGYGEYFIHRLGHSIDSSLHGLGANLDSYETFDEREILPNTCYSIEPGIYLPGQFGVRLEVDILVLPKQTVLQENLSQKERGHLGSQQSAAFHESYCLELILSQPLQISLFD